MPHKIARVADDGARDKKHKHKSLSMLEIVESLKKLEKGTCVKILCEYYGIRSSTVYDLKK